MKILRQSVARAFASPKGRILSAVEPGRARGHPQALGRFFRSLSRAFKDRSVDLSREGRGESFTGPLEGLEFRIDTQRGIFLFQNSLHGVVSISRLDDEDAGSVVELLGVQSLRGEYVPVRKAISARSAALGARHGPEDFSYTSVNELVEEYMEST